MAEGNARKRILFIVPAFTNGAGGAERVITTILRHLDRSDIECHLATILPGTQFLEDLPEDVTIHRLNVSRMRYALAPVVRLVRRLKPDTVLSTVGYANVLLVVARPFLPANTRIIIREATTPSGFLKHEAHNPALWKFFYRHVYPRADQIICLTDAMQRDFHDTFHIPAKKLVRIYNPVDKASVRAHAVSAKNPYSGEGPNIVAAGRLRREKGLDLLIDALSLVRRHIPGAQATILGEGPEEPALRKQVLELGLQSAVQFSGFQQNPWTYLAHADLFVLPSRLEGMPNALLEALALDTPVVATNCVEAISELQSLDSRIVTTLPDDAAALADTILSVLKERDTFRSRPTATNNLSVFDPAEIASRYKRLL